MPFDFKKLEIPEVILVTPRVFKDNRGFFAETYKYSDFAKNNISGAFLQDNHSRSTKDVFRGLHYQKNPKAQAKLVRCIKGEILDIAVDLRKNSPDFKKHVSAILSEENKQMLYIPEGFAHGFLVLSDDAEIVYKTSEEYSPENDAGVIWNDPEININLPVKNPLISQKDADLPLLKNADINF